MKRVYIVINMCLILLILVSVFVKPTRYNALASNLSKSINTKVFIEVEKKKQEETKKQEEIKKQKEQEKEKQRLEEIKKVEETMLKNTTPASVTTDALETQVGTMSAYGPNCKGCSGYLASGFDARNSILYQDKTYGTVRIVAGDRKYPLGTIVRVSGSKLGTFNAIVFDRGGDIGIGRRFMFDLLFHNEAEANGFGTSYNVKFEVLRYGY